MLGVHMCIKPNHPFQEAHSLAALRALCEDGTGKFVLGGG